MKRRLLFSISLTFLLLSQAVSAIAGIKITGRVTDENAQPIMGVTVVEKGSNKGTTTDLNGNYAIEVKSNSSVLRFSYLGYKTQHITVEKKTRIDVKMEPDVNEIDDVVVIGYGVVKKADLTGSVASLKMKDFEESNVASFTSALTGRLPGVLAIQNGGAPGAGIDIKVRGASSVSAGTSPLYVIDGIMMDNSSSEILGASRKGDEGLDPMATINPDDIESIEVLKDASATAIYGSRGANGVIIITTKSGSESSGGTAVRFSAKFGVDYKPQKRIEVLNGEEYEDYMRFMWPLPTDFVPGETELGENLAKYWNADGTPKRSGVNTVWQDEIMKPAWSQDYNVSLSGRAGKTAYYASLGYLDKDGMVKSTNMNRFSYNTKIDTQIKPWLKMGVNLNGSITNNTGIISAHTQTNSGLFTQMLIFRPNLASDDFGDETLSDDDPGNPRNNPVNNIKNILQSTNARRTQGSTYLVITPLKGLEIKSTFGGYFTEAKSKNFYSADSGPGRLTDGEVTHGTSRVTNWLNENIVTYNKTFNKKHTLTAMGGITFQKTITDGFSTTGTNIKIDSQKEESLPFSELFNSTSGLYKSQLMSYLGRLNYNYDDRYLLTASIRADGSSKFPKGNKFSYFPSGAVAWRISEEEFLRNAHWLDMLKIRASYGQTGNQSINNLAALATLGKVYYNFNGEVGGSPYVDIGTILSGIGNGSLKWETTTQYDAGIDLNMFGNRVVITADYYYKHTTDLLITEQLAGISGFESVVRNIGSVNNQGVEFTLSTLNIKGKNFQWSSDLNISFNRNRVIDIGSGDRIAVTPDAIMQGHYPDVFYVREGYPIGAMFGYKTDGLYQLSDFEDFYVDGQFITDPAEQKRIYNEIKADGTRTFTLREGVEGRGGDVLEPGYLKILNKSDEKVYLGSAEPKFFGGFSNRFTYKNWELSVFLQFSYGNKLFNVNHGLLHSRSTFNIERDYYENMWTIDNQSGTMHYYGDGLGREYPTDLQAEDASYLKVKDITLTYSLPRKVLNRIGMKSAKVFVSGKNLFTFTKYTWYDPEYASRNTLTSGLDRYSYPTARTFMFGVSFNF